MMQHDDPASSAAGDVRIVLAIGVAAGVFVTPGWGAELRVSAQTAEFVEFGASAGAGFTLEPPDPPTDEVERMYSVRGFGRFNPRSVDWSVLEFGAGAAMTDTDLVAMTLDASSYFGHRFGLGEEEASRFLFYGGPLLALSVPLVGGEPLSGSGSSGGTDIPTTTFYIGAATGFGVEGIEPTTGGGTIETQALFGFSEEDGAVIFGLSGAPSLTVSAE